MTPTKTNLSRDLYPDLGPEQRAYLASERRPSRHEIADLGPYPVTPEMAGVVEALQRRYVLPWEMVQERYVTRWVRDDFVARGSRDVPLITPVHTHDKLKVFQHVAEARQHWAGTDYQHGLTGVPDAEYEEACSHLLGLTAALSLDEPILAGAALYMPSLPYGPSTLRYIPLIRARWLDLEALVLCEAGALLAREGMLRLPPADAHPLAWDRWYAQDDDWSRPMPARPEVLTVAVTQARANLSRCTTRSRTIDGRPHIRIDTYRSWPGRYAQGPIEEVWVEGLKVNVWNDWIDEESEGGGWLEVDGHLVGKVKHPCSLKQGKDYHVVSGTRPCGEELAQRQMALAKLRDQLTGR